MANSPIQFIGKHKELIPIFACVGMALALASTYVAWKSLSDNQVIFDRRRPYQYNEAEGIKAGVL